MNIQGTAALSTLRRVVGVISALGLVGCAGNETTDVGVANATLVNPATAVTAPETPKDYVAPQDPAVARHLDELMDQKLGFFVHFGIYSQLGCEASWALVDSTPRFRRAVGWADGDADDFKRRYYDLIRSFNPIAFRPTEWAKLAKRTGFRYLIFTAKHHDGFCLWDTKTTDYKVTSPACPFSRDSRADILRQVFDAFRAEGMMISCYLSKPDFSHPDYWDNRGIGVKTTIEPSYDTAADPERWRRFCDFVHRQAIELVRDYGKIDVLWLDSASSVRPEELREKTRKIRPDLVFVNRYDGDRCVDFLTPEQSVPDHPIAVPWECCMTMIDDSNGAGWGYLYDAKYKSVRELLHLLVDVVAKGGNLALDVPPLPSGRLPEPAVARMEAMGRWLAAHGEAIYATRLQSPYRTGDWAYTASKTGTVYAIRLWREGETATELVLDGFAAEGVRAVTHLATGRDIPCRVKDDGRLILSLPADLPRDPYADAFRLESWGYILRRFAVR